MIEVNLLPRKLQKKKIELSDISFLPVLAGVVGIIAAVHLVFSLSMNIEARRLKHLEERWQEILPDKKIADGVTHELIVMRSKIGAIEALIQGRKSWAKKLNDLSNAMIPGVWLNRMWIEHKAVYEKGAGQQQGAGNKPQGPPAGPEMIITKSLHLKGSVMASGGGETALVGKFMWSLKNNAGFFADFSEIETSYMQRTKLKDIEVMEFELVCYFK